MTTSLRNEAATIAAARPDTVVTMSIDARRGFLAEIAEHCAQERGWPSKPFTLRAPEIVPTVASQFCSNPLGVFDELVEATYQRSRFCADEVEWLEVRDMPTDDLSRERQLGRLEADVDDLLDRLLGEALCEWDECTNRTGDRFCSADCENRAARSVGE